jgi:hypothetical protein
MPNNLTAICEPIVYKMLDPRRLTMSLYGLSPLNYPVRIYYIVFFHVIAKNIQLLFVLLIIIIII